MLKQFAIFLTLLLTIPLVHAGSSASPEVTDAVGDASPSKLDVSKAWVTSDLSSIYFHIQVGAFGNMNPLDNGDFQYTWTVTFDSARGPLAAKGAITAEHVPGACILTCVGDWATGSGQTATTVTFEDGNVVTIKMSRNIAGTHFLPTGSMISDIRVETSVTQDFNGAVRIADTTTGSQMYML